MTPKQEEKFLEVLAWIIVAIISVLGYFILKSII